MTLVKTLTLSAMGVAIAGAAFGADYKTARVKIHPSQGKPIFTDNGSARLAIHADGVFANLETDGLTPGNVHTLWFVAINNPAACETQPCTAKDALKRTEIVDADVGYAGGIIVGEDGVGRFTYHQSEGELADKWFTAGLKEASTAEIHLVVNDHGPVLEGRTAEMLATYREGCTDASIPAAMPDTARASGTAGPNECRLVQFAVFPGSMKTTWMIQPKEKGATK